jgi:hypothetical protein
MTRITFRFVLFAFAFAAAEFGCSGGSTPAPVQTATALSSKATVPVGAAQTASVLAGSTVATVAMPAATAGSGSLTILGAASAPPNSASGFVDPITLPGTEIAYVGFTVSASATYATLPTVVFALPSGTSTANETFGLDLYDSISYIVGETVALPGTIGPPSTSGGGPTVSFPAQAYALTLPVTVGAPPILPITLSPGSTYGFALRESTATPSPSAS